MKRAADETSSTAHSIPDPQRQHHKTGSVKHACLAILLSAGEGFHQPRAMFHRCQPHGADFDAEFHSKKTPFRVGSSYHGLSCLSKGKKVISGKFDRIPMEYVLGCSGTAKVALHRKTHRYL